MTARRTSRTTPLRTSPCSSAALARPYECRIELLREDIAALCDELLEELTIHPTIQVVGSSRGEVHMALTRAQFG